MLIGITGNIGCGKSRVAAKLADQIGASVLDSDAVCRRLMEPGQPGYKAFISREGDGFSLTLTVPLIVQRYGKLCLGSRP